MTSSGTWLPRRSTCRCRGTLCADRHCTTGNRFGKRTAQRWGWGCGWRPGHPPRCRAGQDTWQGYRSPSLQSCRVGTRVVHDCKSVLLMAPPIRLFKITNKVKLKPAGRVSTIFGEYKACTCRPAESGYTVRLPKCHLHSHGSSLPAPRPPPPPPPPPPSPTPSLPAPPFPRPPSPPPLLPRPHSPHHPFRWLPLRTPSSPSSTHPPSPTPFRQPQRNTK